MIDDPRSKLIGIGAADLADALLELASRHDDAQKMVQRMLASPEENMARFREEFVELLSDDGCGRFFDGYESEVYANMLSDLLRDLEAAQPEPCAGLDEVAAFYRSFESTMNTCHDAYHHVASVFELTTLTPSSSGAAGPRWRARQPPCRRPRGGRPS